MTLVVSILVFMQYSTPVFAVNHTITMTTSGPQSIDVVMGNSGNGVAISEDEITVNTTCRSGYNLNISTSVSDNNLYRNGDSNINSAGQFFTPSDGSTALATATNTWGYYFDPLLTPTNSSIFSEVPSLGNTPAVIKSPLAEPSNTDISETFSLYYGVNATSTMPAGTYKMVQDNYNNDGAIVYYLTMAEACIPYTIHFDPTSTSTGQTLSGTGTMADQEAYQGTATNLDPITFTAPVGYEFAEWNTAQDGTGVSYSDEAQVTSLTSPGSSITLYAIWRLFPINLYNAVADMSKGTQTSSDLQANITSNNSGVYEYNSSVFGADTDGAKSDSTKATIYYYRGILDSTTGTYGSDGDGEAWPNFVKLGDTCWRIIRTTGSGGIKMIYNGSFTNGTSSNSCANASSDVQITTNAFDGSSTEHYREVVRAGYTYNDSYASTSSTAVNVNTLFGSDSNYSGNDTNSSIKATTESWYNNNLTSFTSLLESNAGYCNDRSAFTSATGATSVTTLKPYERRNGQASNTLAYFGAYTRNSDSAHVPSLACSRNIVDNYSTSTANGGNGQLSSPIALLTADEASFAGSGSTTSSQGSSYNNHSFLRSGSDFWTMSPAHRNNNSGSNTYGTFVFYLASAGNIANDGLINSTHGVRPVISLKEGTEASSGTGTATDPWIIDMP